MTTLTTSQTPIATSWHTRALRACQLADGARWALAGTIVALAILTLLLFA